MSAERSPRRGAAPPRGGTPSRNVRPRLVPTGAGSTYRVPPPPVASEVAPAPGCVRPAQAVPGRGQLLLLPPSPGLRAERRGDVLRVRYAFRSLPRRCRPVRLTLIIDVSGDTLPGLGTDVRVRGERGVVALPVPPALRSADAARATAYTARWVKSRSVGVRIR